MIVVFLGRNGYNLEKGELKFWKNILNEGDNPVVYCVDRLSRSVFHGLGFLNELYQKGVSVHFLLMKQSYIMNICHHS